MSSTRPHRSARYSQRGSMASLVADQRSIPFTMEDAMKPTVYLPALSVAALAACNSLSAPATPRPSYTTYQAQGVSATISNELGAFRTALGGALKAPNSPPAPSGRREINWDGGPSAGTN